MLARTLNKTKISKAVIFQTNSGGSRTPATYDGILCDISQRLSAFSRSLLSQRVSPVNSFLIISKKNKTLVNYSIISNN